MCLFFKATYFLSLVDNVAPLIDIIFQILFDIKYFIVVLMIFVLMIAMCFQLLASLQVDFDGIDEEEKKTIVYYDIQASVWYGM